MAFSRAPHNFVAGEVPPAAVWNALSGGRVYSDIASPGNSGIVAEADQVSWSVTQTSPRTYMFLGTAAVSGTNAGDQVTVKLYAPGITYSFQGSIASAQITIPMIAPVDVNAGTDTWKVSCLRSTGSGSITFTAVRWTILDIGG